MVLGSRSCGAAVFGLLLFSNLEGATWDVPVESSSVQTPAVDHLLAVPGGGFIASFAKEPGFQLIGADGSLGRVVWAPDRGYRKAELGCGVYPSGRIVGYVGTNAWLSRVTYSPTGNLLSNFDASGGGNDPIDGRCVYRARLNSVTATDLVTGRVKWVSSLAGDWTNSQVLGAPANRDVFLVKWVSGVMVQCLNGDTGAVRWSETGWSFSLSEQGVPFLQLADQRWVRLDPANGARGVPVGPGEFVGTAPNGDPILRENDQLARYDRTGRRLWSTLLPGEGSRTAKLLPRNTGLVLAWGWESIGYELDYARGTLTRRVPAVPSSFTILRIDSVGGWIGGTTLQHVLADGTVDKTVVPSFFGPSAAGKLDFRAGPALDGGALVSTREGSKVLRLNSDGTLRWAVTVEGDMGVGAVSQPSPERVLVSTSRGAALMNDLTGELVWRREGTYQDERGSAVSLVEHTDTETIRRDPLTGAELVRMPAKGLVPFRERWLAGLDSRFRTYDLAGRAFANSFEISGLDDVAPDGSVIGSLSVFGQIPNLTAQVCLNPDGEVRWRRTYFANMVSYNHLGQWFVGDSVWAVWGGTNARLKISRTLASNGRLLFVSDLGLNGVGARAARLVEGPDGVIHLAVEVGNGDPDGPSQILWLRLNPATGARLSASGIGNLREANASLVDLQPDPVGSAQLTYLLATPGLPTLRSQLRVRRLGVTE